MHARPIVVVSRCLGFEACRYNGARLDDGFVSKLAPHVTFKQVCPEADIGMGTPRAPVRLVERDERIRLVQPETSRDFTEKMTHFANRYVAVLGEVDGFILKNRSPTCAISDARLYPDRENVPPLGRVPGIFGRAVLDTFPSAAIEDEGRLQNFRIREHFLIKLFALARLRAAAERPTMRKLVQFHAEHKLLLMGYSQTALRRLGKIVANHERLTVEAVWARYQSAFPAALARPPRYASSVNVLQHALGFFKDGLRAREKSHFLDVLAGYREGKYPLSAAIAVVRSWLARFDEPYLEKQIFFEPYPPALVEITDSGKGRGKL